MTEALVTVLIAQYRCESYLIEAIRSVLAQNLPLRVVVIDDASPDPSPLRAIRDRLAGSGVAFLQAERNVGQFALYNAVLPGVDTPYVALQDADDRSLPGRFGAQMSAIAAGADLVGCAALLLGGQEDGQLRQPPRDVNAALRLRRRGGIFIGPTLFAKTGFLRALGGYDGTTRIGGDTDLVCRAVFLGKVENLPEPYYAYRQRDGSLTSSAVTGFGSPARRRYSARLARRFYANRLRAWAGRPALLRTPAEQQVVLSVLD